MIPSPQEITDFRLKAKSKGDVLINQLVKVQPFMEAINTSVGKEILNEGLKQLEKISENIIEEKATLQELAEFRVLYTILKKWSEKIDFFYNGLKTIKEVALK